MNEQDLQKLVEILGGENFVKRILDREYLVYLSINPNHMNEVRRREYERDCANYLSHCLHPYSPEKGRQIVKNYQRWFSSPGSVPMR